jgi:LysM repeat protein
MFRLSFVTSVLLAFALTAALVGLGFYTGILPTPRGATAGSPSPRPSGFAVVSPTPSVATAEPTQAPTPEATPTVAGDTYVVQEGDFLSGIGEELGVPWQLIAEANGIQPPDYTIQVGQVLIIPDVGAIPSGSGGLDGDTYVVQAGDSVIGIAEALGVDPTDLADFNNLADWNSIQPGQVLYIPGPGWTPRPLESPDT